MGRIAPRQAAAQPPRRPQRRSIRLTPAVAMRDAALLGTSFSGPSWDRWRAVLKGAYGERLSTSELALFREVAERDPPKRQVRELWCIAGRRGGKDAIASAIATVAGIADYRPYLRPGERASIVCLAVDREQAKIVHRYIVAYFTSNPLLRPLVERETDTGLELNNAVEILVVTNSFRAVRGRTVVCAICDECAYWRDEESATPDVETYNALLPGLATLPGSMLVGISTPYRRAGLLFERWRAAYGKDDPDVLVVRGASRLFNPTLPQLIIDAALKKDPEAASAEWLAEWRSDLADFVDRAVVEGAVVPGRFELPPAPGTSYLAFIDPSGGSSDSMTLAIGHRDRATKHVIIDALREVRPPFRPDEVTREFAALLKAYRISKVFGDRYAGEWPRERFKAHGVTYEPADQVKGDLYRDLLPLLNSGRIELLDSQRLVAQLLGLERRTRRGGRDSIDHPAGSHDDIANALAGVAVLAASKPVGFDIGPRALAWARGELSSTRPMPPYGPLPTSFR